jgi:hypothetical protein
VNGNGESGDGDAGEIGVGENEDVGEGACALASAYEGEQYGEAVEAVLHAREGLKSGAHVGAVGGWGHPSQAVRRNTHADACHMIHTCWRANAHTRE